MNIRTLSMALVFTGIALLAERMPVPDANRLERAADAWAADAGLGIQTLAWETARAWDQVDVGAADLGLARPSEAALLGAAGTLLLALLGLNARTRLASRLRTRAARPSRAAARPRAGARTARAASRPADRRLARAQSLARKGGPSLDVARRTTLSRDAVELLARLHTPDGIAGGGRSFRGAVA